MISQIVPPIITGIVAIAVCVINNIFQSRKTLGEFKAHTEKTDEMIEYRLDELTKRVDNHNNVIERTYKLEQDYAVQNEQIKEINKNIINLAKVGA